MMAGDTQGSLEEIVQRVVQVAQPAKIILWSLIFLVAACRPAPPTSDQGPTGTTEQAPSPPPQATAGAAEPTAAPPTPTAPKDDQGFVVAGPPPLSYPIGLEGDLGHTR